MRRQFRPDQRQTLVLLRGRTDFPLRKVHLHYSHPRTKTHLHLHAEKKPKPATVMIHRQIIVIKLKCRISCFLFFFLQFFLQVCCSVIGEENEVENEWGIRKKVITLRIWQIYSPGFDKSIRRHYLIAQIVALYMFNSPSFWFVQGSFKYDVIALGGRRLAKVWPLITALGGLEIMGMR